MTAAHGGGFGIFGSVATSTTAPAAYGTFDSFNVYSSSSPAAATAPGGGFVFGATSFSALASVYTFDGGRFGQL